MGATDKSAIEIAKKLGIINLHGLLTIEGFTNAIILKKAGYGWAKFVDSLEQQAQCRNFVSVNQIDALSSMVKKLRRQRDTYTPKPRIKPSTTSGSDAYESDKYIDENGHVRSDGYYTFNGSIRHYSSDHTERKTTYSGGPSGSLSFDMDTGEEC